MLQLKNLIGALALSIVASSSVSAEIIKFDLNGVYTVGAKRGQVLSATISYDNTQTATLFSPFSNANENYYIIPSFTFTNAVNMPAVEDAINIGVQDGLNATQSDAFIFNLSKISFSFSGNYQSFSGPTVPRLNMLQIFNKTFNYSGTSDAGSGTFTITPVVAPVPEPASWGFMVAGFGLIGSAMRKRKTCRATFG